MRAVNAVSGSVSKLARARMMGVDPMAASLDWLGMEDEPRFLRNSKLKPTDVYCVPANG